MKHWKMKKYSLKLGCQANVRQKRWPIKKDVVGESKMNFFLSIRGEDAYEVMSVES
jgi:hypothetical protein